MAASDQRPTTLIFTHGGGRFANQLMLFAHLIGLAQEHPWLRVVNHSFWRFSDLCEGTLENPLCVYPPDDRRGGEWMARFTRRANAVLPRQVSRGFRVIGPPTLHRLMFWRSLAEPAAPAPIGDPWFIDQVRGRRTVLLSGFWPRDWRLFEKHQDAARAFLVPVRRHRDVAQGFITDLRKRFDPLVGVMLRGTDYRLWENGQFFFTAQQYRGFMEQLRTRFGPNTGFVIAADEVHPPDAFAGVNATLASGAMGQAGHYLESFCELSLCDYIATPPSTFSAWAAFFRRLPIIPISSATDDLVSAAEIRNNLFEARTHPTFRRAVN